MHKSGKKIKILGGLGALALTFFPVQANEESQQYANNLESKTKQVQYDKSAYENSALEHLTQALAPGKAHAGEKTVGETLEEPYASKYGEIMEIAREGNSLQVNEEYKEGLPILEEAVEKWEKFPEDKLEGDVARNYAATLAALAGCYVHTTLNAQFLENDPYPNSLERLSKGEELAAKAIEFYGIAQETAKTQESAETAYKFSSGSFNVKGLANKYLGNLDRAEELYKEAIERRDNEDAMYNLIRLEDNYDVFLR